MVLDFVANRGEVELWVSRHWLVWSLLFLSMNFDAGNRFVLEDADKPYSFDVVNKNLEIRFVMY